MKNNDREEIREEYDFSEARRLRYASRLSDRARKELLRRSADLDAQYWFGHALQRVQELEALIVACLSLALDRTPQAAGDEAIALFEGPDLDVLSGLIKSFSELDPLQSAFEERFRQVMAERAWLVHKGGFALRSDIRKPRSAAAVVDRLETLSEEASDLAGELRAGLEKYLADYGLTEEQVRQRTEQAIRHWVAA